MIVPSMTPEQVVREAMLDLPTMWNKMKEPIKRLMRLSKVDARVRDKEHLYEYRSHTGNNWLVVMRPTKKVLSIIPYVWYRGSDDKLRAARIHDDGLCFHISGHVFDQYFARFNKEKVSLDRLKEFVVENMDMGVEQCDQIGELRVGVRHGYLTGVWVVPESIVQLTTFVDHGKLFPEQLEQMDRLDAQRYEHAHPGRRLPPGHRKPWEQKPGHTGRAAR